jgi:hypothetical protein
MQERVIEFNFVCSRDAVKIKEFLDKVPRSIECINYMTILNKLVKNDYLQYEPSDAVVSTYLIKSLQQALTSSSTLCLYYVVSDTDYQTISSIMSYAESQSDTELEYVMHHTKDVDLSEVKDLFKQIIEFD